MSLSIQNVEIKKLFGYYDYDLRKGDNSTKDLSNLLILYGDNGSGKTTILKIIFYLLSTELAKGHKSELVITKFEKISIFFNDGLSIHALREPNELLGAYTLVAKEDGVKVFSHKISLDKENSIIIDDELIKYYSYIQKRNVSIFYLSDKRFLNIVGGHSEFDFNDNDDSDLYSSIHDPRRRSKRGLERDFDENLLNRTIERVTKKFQIKNFAGSKKGEQDTYYIYKEIIKRIAFSDKKENIEVVDLKLDYFIDEFKKLSNICFEYSKYGLISQFNYEEFEEILNTVKNSKKSIIYNVLEPFTNGLKAKIEALKDLYELIDLFVQNVNLYLNNKLLKFNIDEGFRIEYMDKEEIKPLDLSSGEKQLMLLLCNAILAGGKATLFLIDEPEISLNIKWQRQLLDSLLRFTKNGNSQYIIASHSLEILATHKNNVVKLEM